MNTQPKDFDNFDIYRLSGLVGEPQALNGVCCLDYWLSAKDAVTVRILFDSKYTLKLALMAARCMDAGGTLKITYPLGSCLVNTDYCRENFMELLDFRGSELVMVDEVKP